MMDSFLMVGQSNMAGRGHFGEVEPLPNDRCMVMRQCLWQPMYQPVNGDKVFSGVNLTESFARLYADDNPEKQIGLIPCAYGGSSLNEWMPGEFLYDNAVFHAKQALKTSSLKAILWHQGESDSTPELAATYKERFLLMINSMKKDIGVDVPVLVGGLGDYLTQNDEDRSGYKTINATLMDICQSFNNFYFVSAENLTSNDDFLHFNSKSLREFGRRYFNVYKENCDGNMGIA